MNIALFGAAGFTGRATLASLTAHGHRVRGFDRGPDAWAEWKDTDGALTDGEAVHGDIVDFDTVNAALDGMDAVIHMVIHSTGDPNDSNPFLINLKGLWNVLESARQRGISKVVHVGSCQTVHPSGTFFDRDVRRPDWGQHAVSKRLQEEMCRQFAEAHPEASVFVLRADYIVDSRLGIGRHREALGENGRAMREGWVCRHDLAEACRLAAESDGQGLEVLHVVGTPNAHRTCNVARAKEALGLTFKGDLTQYARAGDVKGG
jgi:nucleoside-diphosphate-sugar epimerase